MYYQMGKYYEHLYDLLEDDCDFALMDHIYVFLVSSLFIHSIINIIVYLWLIILFLRVYIHQQRTIKVSTARARIISSNVKYSNFQKVDLQAILKEYLESAHSDSADYPKMAGMSASVDKYALEISTTLMHFVFSSNSLLILYQREQEKPAVTFSDTPLKPVCFVLKFKKIELYTHCLSSNEYLV